MIPSMCVRKITSTAWSNPESVRSGDSLTSKGRLRLSLVCSRSRWAWELSQERVEHSASLQVTQAGGVRRADVYRQIIRIRGKVLQQLEIIEDSLFVGRFLVFCRC